MHVLMSAHVGFEMNWAVGSGIKWEGEIAFNAFYNVKIFDHYRQVLWRQSSKDE